MQNTDKQTPIESLFFQSKTNRDHTDYAEAIRSLLEFNPIDMLESVLSEQK